MKVCPNCGAHMADSEKFCGNCGAKQPESTVNQNTQNTNYNTQNTGYPNNNPNGGQYHGGYQPVNKPTSGLAIASLVLGICTWVFGWFTYGIPGMVGIVLGAIAISQCKKGDKGGGGMAIAGLVLSIIQVVIVLIAAIWLMYVASTTVGYYSGLMNELYSYF